jgi:hypothetical protein
MTKTEMVTEFKLKDGDKPTQVVLLMGTLNAYLASIGLQPEEYGFNVAPACAESDRIPERYRWLVAFAIEGGSEGYYIHVAAIDSATGTYTNLGLAKTYSAKSAYALAREAQRFLTAAAWN